MDEAISCQVQDCPNMIFQISTNSRHLCKKHEVLDRHKNASAQTAARSDRTAPPQKPIDKSRLYRINPDDELRPLLKRSNNERKRKRQSSAGGSSGYEAVSATGRESALLHNISKDISSRPPTEQRPGHARFNLGRHSSLEDTSETDSLRNNLTARSGFSSRENERPGSAALRRASGVHDGLQQSTSPEYESSPADILFSRTTEAHEGGIPGSQITQESRTNVDTQSSKRPSVPNQSLFIEDLQIQEQVEQDLLDDFIQVALERSNTSGPEDQVMRDLDGSSPEPLRTTNETTLPQSKTDHVDILLVSPVLTSVSSSTPPADDLLLQEVIEEVLAENPWGESLEAKRERKTAKFNSAGLDIFLQKQSCNTGPTFQPTPEELGRTQIWGHIDPRTSWPAQFSHEWLEKKKIEIAARGGRKANFGKLLTPQIISERADKGWNIHQNKQLVDDEKSEEGLKALEELFGIKAIDDFEPGARDGRLAMIEKTMDENSRRKRIPKVFQVG